jgi:hypothetical protein
LNNHFDFAGHADRRGFLAGAALLALALGIPEAAFAGIDADAGDSPDPRQQRILLGVCDLVIPRSDTPGAAETGVADFVVLALAHGLDNTRAPVAAGSRAGLAPGLLRADGSLRHVAWLEHDLDRRAGGDILTLAPGRRGAVLAALDAEAFAPGASSPWVAIKGLILTGYYTSQVGGAQELRYELVPGRFDPDLPLRPGDRAWSSDWTAVDFG